MQRTWTGLHHLIGKVDKFFKPTDRSVGSLHCQLIGHNLCLPSENLRVNVRVRYLCELVLCRLKHRLGGGKRSVGGGFGSLQADDNGLVPAAMCQRYK